MTTDNSYEFDDYLDEIGTVDFERVVITGTDWTTETIIRQIEKGNIRLSPIFQRRDAWTVERKSLFIESILIGMPIPQLVLAEDPNEKGKYIVLDGKQRLLSILQFAATNSRDRYPPLRLKKLPILDNLNGKTYEDLQNDDYNFSTFENQWIRTVIIKNSPSEVMLSQVFYRLNTGSLPLSPQELRFALYPSPFTTYIDECSEASSAMQYYLGNSSVDFRMRDVELMLRMFTNFEFIREYKGNLKAFLDNGFRVFSQRYDEFKEKLDNYSVQIEAAHKITLSIFGDDSYKKWSGDSFESRRNRAIFEILIYVFSDERVRNKVNSFNHNIFKDMFISLFTNSPDFVSSIERTTKSIEAVSTRFNLLIDKINETYGTEIKNIELQRG
ncbi:DUF262 domain-containing protein [Aeromonas caviae]|uniref:DUF262 domain-containing protein n=1 Tax=Aeromonas caviae TaxID=648 RepID=UPI000A65A804|nr:DUF262 domain-containing protein [Aeromonas caviae]AUU21440.1 hypothetical protein MC60_005265 [Aeromonas caviae]MDX7855402.1 DUF262 domain-containing protein [Aeromonas caviae]QOK20701.1 DUF262 domain-containing protein [Aeromonas caviae]